jgi:predicted Zn-dependent peptidase
MFKQSVLKNGLRIITVEMPVLRSVASMVFIKAGARNETPELSGLSHFLEHMVFKGTKKYHTQAAVAEAIEGVGGILNAWTSLDHTSYWNKVPKERVATAIDVLSEFITSPQIREDDLNRERGVIIEEINKYQDLPQRFVGDLIYQRMYPDHPLGQFIIGTKENIRRFAPKDFFDYKDVWYRPENMAIAVAGNVKHEDVVNEFEQRLTAVSGKMIARVVPVAIKQVEPWALVHEKKTDQAHMIIGIRGVSYRNDDRFAIDVLNAVLGEGMSSRLFMRIREEQGLAYSVYSESENFDDAGDIQIYAGLNIEKLDDAIKAIIHELTEFKEKKVPTKELTRVKEYLRGTTSLSLDEPEAMAGWFGKQLLFEPDVVTPDEYIAKLMAVSADHIQQVAKKYFTPQNLSIAVIAPIAKKREQSFTNMLGEV